MQYYISINDDFDSIIMAWENIDNHWYQIQLQMTSGEMKFALVVESVLNSVPEPEYRQMLVEALCVVSMVVENQVTNITLNDMAIRL